MALVTRCSNPGCLTLFRVTPAQLQAFGGQVRCGSCNSVFDAFPSLTTVADSALKAPEQVAAGAAVAAPAAEPSEAVVETPAQPASPGALTDAAADAAPVESESPVSVAPVDDRPPLPDDHMADGDRRPPEFGAGEKVSEWTPLAGATMVDAGIPSAPMAVERVPDLPPEGSLDFVEATAATLPDAAQQAPSNLPETAPESKPGFAPESAPESRSPVAEAVVSSDAPADMPAETLAEPAVASSASSMPAVAATVLAAAPAPVDPVPQIAPELTDYSVTRGQPQRDAPVAGRGRLVLVFGGLLLTVAAGAMIFAGDRLPAPLARLFAPAELVTVLREHALTVAVMLVALLCWVLRRYRTTWIVAAVVLSLLLGAQLLFAYRTQIAALYPASRPLLEQACRVARCEVGLPKAADQLLIESSDLQAVDAARPNLIQLAASVRNRAAIEVAFPAIEVTLTDAQDRPLARRVLLPDQYLAGRPPASAGLRAGEEFSIRLTLDTTELRPVGYRLYLFYP